MCCACECARAQFSCARVHVRVCACSYVCGMQHCTAQCLYAPCCASAGACACARGVCGACISRVMRARGASARVRGLAIPGAGMFVRPWGSQVLPLEGQRQVLKTLKKTLKDLFDVEGDVDDALEELEGRFSGRCPPVLGSVPLLCARWSFSIGGRRLPLVVVGV